MKKIILLAGIIIVGVLIGFFFLRGGDVTEGESLGEANIKYPSDVIGTKTGTTTAGVYFASRATSTYKVKSGNMVDEMTFTILATNASTTPGSWVNFSLLGSSDWDCMTATTTNNVNDTTNEQVLTTDVNWYDIGHLVAELAGTQTLSTGTSTITWASAPSHSTSFTLSHLNYECVAVQISASSTEVLMQVRNK